MFGSASQAGHRAFRRHDFPRIGCPSRHRLTSDKRRYRTEKHGGGVRESGYTAELPDLCPVAEAATLDVQTLKELCPMKKARPNKLTLSRETLRQIDDRATAHVAAGYLTYAYASDCACNPSPNVSVRNLCWI
jgi:hypothetical protein